MTMGVEQVSELNMIAGGIFAALSFLVMTRHQGFQRGIKTFPRSRFWGMLLTAIALLWSAIMIDRMTLGELSQYKWLLYVLTPLSFYLIIQFLDELLAARAFGGLLMLMPVVMVESRWHSSPWRLVVIVLAYVMVVAGIWLMLCPFKFRMWTAAISTENPRRPFIGMMLAIISILLFIAAWFTR